MTFIRVRTRYTYSYIKGTTQFNHHILPPIIKMRQLSHYFLNWISTDILEKIYWSDDEIVSDPVICNNSSSTYSKSSSTSYDNPTILQSIYPILDKFNSNTSKLDDTPLDVRFLKNLLSEVSCILIDNNINMNLEKWGGRGKK